MSPPARREQDATSSRPNVVIPYAVLLLVFALFVVASLASIHRLWGIHHLAYTSPAVRWAAVCLIGVTFLPPVARPLYRWLLAATGRLPHRMMPRALISGGGAVAAFVVFVRFPSATELLGDGQLQANLLRRFITDMDAPLSMYVGFIAKEPVAFATNLVNFLLARFVLSAGYSDPLAGWRIFYALLGGAYVFIAMGVLTRKEIRAEVRLIIVCTAVLTGALQLFFGYIETYTPVLFITAGYLMLAFRFLCGRGRIASLVATVVLAIAFHSQALLLVPSLAWIITWAMIGRQRPKLVGRLTWIVALVTVAATFVARTAPATARFFLPLLSEKRVYGIFAPRHFLDILNEVLLVAPLAVVFMAVAAASRRPRGGSRENIDCRVGFGIALFVPCFLFLWLFYPELGMAHDWDLFVLAVAGIVVLPAVMLSRSLERGAAQPILQAVTIPALAVSAGIVIPWLAVNASDAGSERRYADILAADDTGGSYAFEILALHHRDRGNLTGSVNAWRKAYELSPNPRYLYTEGSVHLENGDTLQAIATIVHCMTKHPRFEKARRAYVDYLAKTNQADELLRVSREGTRLFPDEPYYYFYVGSACIAKRMFAEAGEAFEQCLRLNPPKNITDAISKIERQFQHPPPQGGKQ